MESGHAPALPALWKKGMVKNDVDRPPAVPHGSRRSLVERKGLGVPAVQDGDYDLGFPRVAG